jgi:hypothetical protein
MGDGRPLLHDIVAKINALPMGTTMTHNHPEPSNFVATVSEQNTFVASSMPQDQPYDSVESGLGLEEICMFMDTDAGLHWLQNHMGLQEPI